MTKIFERPLRASRHCRHYSYRMGLGDDNGPHCAVDIDLSEPGITRKCMPEPAVTCSERQDYTDAERAAWERYQAERMKRLSAAVQALPHPIELNRTGEVPCPNCDGGRIIYMRWHRGASLQCTTENCCEARFNIKAGADWPAGEESCKLKK